MFGDDKFINCDNNIGYMAGRVYLLNGLPTGFLADGLRNGYNGIMYIPLDKEHLTEILNKASIQQIVNSIRHQSTRDLILSLVVDKSRVVDQQIINFNDISDGDYVIVIAPKQLVARGQDQQVTFDDLAIFSIRFINVGLDDVNKIFP